VPAPIGMANAEDWASSTPQAGRASRLADEQSFQFPQRKSIGAHRSGSVSENDQRSPKQLSQRRRPPQFAVQVSGGRVAGRDGEVISPDNWLLYDAPLTAPLNRRDLSNLSGATNAPEEARSIEIAEGSKALTRGPLPRPVEYNESVAVIATRSCKNYYHWMIDALPRLSSPVMKSEFTQFACGATMITSIAVSPCISAMMAMARSTSD